MIRHYKKCIDCNKKLLESWSEGQHLVKMAEIYFIYKSNFKAGMDCLREAQIAFKLAGKYNNSLRVMIEFSDKIEEMGRTTDRNDLIEVSVTILKEGWDDSINFLNDPMVRIGIDSLYSKLIDNYLRDQQKYIEDAIEATKVYLKI